LKIPAYWNNAISGFLLLLIVISDSKFQRYLKIKQFNRRKKDFTKKDVVSKGGGVQDDKPDEATY
jgi:AI-2 transport system permease protein